MATMGFMTNLVEIKFMFFLSRLIKQSVLTPFIAKRAKLQEFRRTIQTTGSFINHLQNLDFIKRRKKSVLAGSCRKQQGSLAGL
jgi:hypothetical protein